MLGTNPERSRMTKVHDLSTPRPRAYGDGPNGSHGVNRKDRHIPDSERFPAMSVRRIPVDSTPYGSSISRNGRTLWGGFHYDELVAVGATSGEAKRHYIDWSRRQSSARAEGKRKDEGLHQ